MPTCNQLINERTLLRTIATVHSQPTIATSTRSAWSRYEIPVPAVYVQLEGPSPNYGSKIILALFDSGAHSSMLLEEHAEGLKMSKPALPAKWSTPGKRTFQTKQASSTHQIYYSRDYTDFPNVLDNSRREGSLRIWHVDRLRPTRLPESECSIHHAHMPDWTQLHCFQATERNRLD